MRYYYHNFLKNVVDANAPTPEPLSVDEALRRIQSEARYLFRTTDLAKMVGKAPNGPALKFALLRSAKAGRIALVSKRPSTWLIVPPEHEHYGAPPVEWWLNDFLEPIEPGYYVALLSAARHWGSGHYAHQSVQVMVSRQRAPLSIGKLRIEFIYKKNVASTPVTRVRGEIAPLRVSTREATLLDLLRHQSEIGGLEAIVRIAKDFAAAMTASGLTDALDALGLAPPAQRLGFVLERLHQKRLCPPVERWLASRRPTLQPLEPAPPPGDNARTTDPRWAVWFTRRQQEQIEELA